MAVDLATQIPCASCGFIFQNSTAWIGPNASPCPGDYAVCMNCGAPHIFNEDLSLRPATFADIDALDPRDAERLGFARAVIERRHTIG